MSVIRKIPKVTPIIHYLTKGWILQKMHAILQHVSEPVGH